MRKLKGPAIRVIHVISEDEERQPDGYAKFEPAMLMAIAFWDMVIVDDPIRNRCFSIYKPHLAETCARCIRQPIDREPYVYPEDHPGRGLHYAYIEGTSASEVITALGATSHP